MTASPAAPGLGGRRVPVPRISPVHFRAHASRVLRERRFPGRRGLQVCLGLVWLLDAVLQFQPYMFGPFFVTQVIQPAIAGNPAVIAGPATWASQFMLHHIAVYNASFAVIQLLIAAGILYRRTARLALAASVVWALSVWWFGEGLGGILTGASPLAGLPGGVVLYALIAVLLWPPARAPESAPAPPVTSGDQHASAALRPPLTWAAASGPLGATAAKILWLVLWGSFAYFLLLPANRVPGTIAGMLAATDGQPGWLVWIMNGMSGLAGQRDLAVSVVLAAACAFTACGVFSRRVIRPALVTAAVLGLLFWLAEGLGGIFTGQGTDPNTGPLLILLAACFWPRTGRAPAARTERQHDAAVPGLALGVTSALRASHPAA
jgi:hypothetical protein